MQIGRELRALVEGAREELLLVAPFMREAVVRDLLQHCSTAVVVTCVTRWRPEEILQHVSDLEVADVVAARDDARLFLRHDLHAKLYRADGQALVGSANLTRMALGWVPQPNLELLIRVPGSDQTIVDFERRLFTGAVPADAQRRADVQAAVDAMRQSGWVPPPWADIDIDINAGAVEGVDSSSGGSEVDLAHWLPMCRTPRRLHRAYMGDTSAMTKGNYEDALRDLSGLSVPIGLDRNTFYSVVASALSQTPVVRAVDQFISGGPRHVREMAELVSTFMEPTGELKDSRDAWDTLLRWLGVYFPDRYRTTQTDDGTFFELGRIIGKWTP